MAGKPCPFQRILTFFDPLFCRATLVIKRHYITGFPAKISHDKTKGRGDQSDEARSEQHDVMSTF